MALRTVLDSLGVADEGLAEVRAWYADIAAALGNCAGASAVRERGREAGGPSGSACWRGGRR